MNSGQVVRPRLVIAGTHSGVGKTTFATGLMAAFQKRGVTIQGYKVGPDYIDPTFHTLAVGKPSRNLDPWMASAEVMQEVYARSSAAVDLSIIEGVMGLYDGKDPLGLEGSTAQVSMLLQAPVLLVIDASAVARSAAAMVRGFQLLEPSVHIAGVLVNRVGSEGHYRLVQSAVEAACGIPTVGYLTLDDEWLLPERHLGLVPALEHGSSLQATIARLAERLEVTCQLDLIEQIAHSAAPLTLPAPRVFTHVAPSRPVKIAIAKDAAFHFYYQENLELLEAAGTELVPFSPLANEPVPAEANGLYLGGGFPEAFAEQLSKQTGSLSSVRAVVERGMPTFAECGGLMYLTEFLETTAGQTFQMAGVIPARVQMQKRLAAIGYRDVTALHDGILLRAGERIRGHEFHYSTIYWSGPHTVAYKSVGYGDPVLEGYLDGNLQAGYTHLYFPSHPACAERFVTACAAYRS